MKLVKVTIRRGQLNENAMMYPLKYNAVEVDRMGMYATTLNKAGVSLSGGLSRAEDHEFCIIALPDTLAVDYATDPDMEIVNEVTADSLMERWRMGNGTPEDVVTDVARIQAITAKQNAAITLTQEDLDALNPDSPVKGINKSRRPVREVLGDKLTA